MPGVLYVVSTPIGNLEDITLRALRVLRDVSVIAAEDTRRTRQLLTHFDIHTKLLSLHAHNERAKGPALVARLSRGESVALVSDAGTPLVSDPGLALVKLARAADIRVEAVPGASAVLAALVVAGVDTSRFRFVGFAPQKAGLRSTWLASIGQSPETVVFFEAPHRIIRTLGELQNVLGIRPIFLTRELTKVHEETLSGTCEEVAGRLGEPRGEFTVVVPHQVDGNEYVNLTGTDIYYEFCRLTKNGCSRREAISTLARNTHRRQREIYRIVEDARQTEEVGEFSLGDDTAHS